MTVYGVHGSFMIFTKSFFKKGGDFKHGAFLYNEEITVAEFCRKKSLKCFYDPSLSIEHREHGSVGMIYSSTTLKFLKEASRFAAETYFNE